MKWLKILWALPLTLFGVLPALLVWLCRGHARVIEGALEFHGPLADWILRRRIINFTAVTIGHIIIGRDANCCGNARAHELEHVRQGERWGPLFPFAYCGSGLFQVLRGRHFYLDNAFEVAARNAAARGKRATPSAPNESYLRRNI